MKRCLLVGLAGILLVSLGGVVGCGPATVTFPDTGLEAAIREAIDKPEGVILPADLEGLTTLRVAEIAITDLSGLEHCLNLTELLIISNQLSDISPLASLTNLTKLVLGSNQVSDISPLASLTGLNWLELIDSQISDISSLASLTNLTSLTLMFNQVDDISPLVSLSNLRTLWILQGNPLSIESVNTYVPQLEERGVNILW